MTPDRKKLLLTAWLERGRREWQPEIHGRGLATLNISAEVKMRPRGPLGTPIPPYDNLEFQLLQKEINGQKINAIACEGVIVEPLVAEDSRLEPVRFKSSMAHARRRRRGC